MPGIAADIYKEFDAALRRLEDEPKPLFSIRYATPEEMADLRSGDPFAHRRMLPPLEKPKDQATRLSRFIPDYLDHLEKNGIGNIKERRTKRTKCEEFKALVGDLHLADIKKIHAYKYAEWLNSKGLAHNTIASSVSRISKLLVRAEQLGLIDSNPFTNLALADYGKPTEHYLPFSPDEMHAIFKQQIPNQERLALTLLATTGARLDEIALLEWSQIKEEHGIAYLDLRSVDSIKNNQSRRVIPIHSKVKPMLQGRGEGRIFSYSVDGDGKAQNAAGKRLSPYIDNIVEHHRKVLHSFRGTFKDMLKDAGVTAEMADKLESGEVQLSELADAINARQVSKELNDRITGHAMKDVAGRYGLGHALIPRAAAIEKLSLSFLLSD